MCQQSAWRSSTTNRVPLYSGDFSIRSVLHQPPHKLVSANIQADSTSRMPRKLTWPVIRGYLESVSLLATVILTDVRLSISRDEPIMDLGSCCRFQMQLLAAKNTHGAQGCAKCMEIRATSLLFKRANVLIPSRGKGCGPNTQSL